MKRPTLRQFNHGLSVVVIVLCLYVIVAPFLPMFTSRIAPTPELVVSEEKGTPPAKIPDANTLVIPRIKLQQTIHENAVPQWGLAKGVWRDPDHSSPDLGGNTAMSGHRFTYAGQAVFYNLDKVKVGDKIVTYWNKQRHEYHVTKVWIVKPHEKWVLDKTDNDVLTVYTCTPLFTAENRLVVRAEKTERMP